MGIYFQIFRKIILVFQILELICTLHLTNLNMVKKTLGHNYYKTLINLKQKFVLV